MDASRKTFLAVMMSALSLLSSATDVASLEPSFARIRAISDKTCTVTDVSFRTKADRDDKQIEVWRAEAKEKVKETGPFVRVDFTLVPEKGSDIKCRAVLPLSDRWDGRFWGVGNSGRAGSLPSLNTYLAMNTAAVTTDLGTPAASSNFRDKSLPWAEGVLRDFHWRATHLMTVYGKRIVKAFYGRPHKYAYFRGGSTGGRQGMSEVLRYPDDYDGVISILPDNNAAVNEIAHWHLWRQTHGADGKPLFTKKDFAVLADAAVEFRAGTDPKPFAGRVLADARFDEKDIDGFLALAAKKQPSLAKGDRLARLKSLYMPLMHEGKCYFSGFAPGVNHARNSSWCGIVSIANFLAGKGYPKSRWSEVGFKQIDMYLKELAPEFNACSADVSAFLKRGGKIIMTTGWEDQTISPGPIVDYYERVCEANGGIESLSQSMRLFCIPGCAHGGGKGRVLTGSPSGRQLADMLVNWREKGEAPKRILVKWRDAKMTIPVAAYPGLFVQNAKGKWTLKKLPRGVTRIDESCLATKIDVSSP